MTAEQGAERRPQVFRSVTAVIVWWVWVLFALANLIDLMVQGGGHLSLVAAAILLVVTGIAYVTAERPRVLAGAEALTVRNPVRDHVIPWPNVIRAELSDLLRIRFRQPAASTDQETSAEADRAVSAWAVHYSRRKQFVSETKARRAQARGSRAGFTFGGGGLGLGGSGGGGGFSGGGGQYGTQRTRTADPTSAEAQAEQSARYINDYAAGVPADVPLGTVTSTWNWTAIAVLVVPALFLLIVALT